MARIALSRALASTARAALPVALLALAWPLVASARGVPCPGGHFSIEGAPLVPGGQGPDEMTIAGEQLSLGSGCGPTSVRLRATRRGTKVRARWRSCSGLRGRVRLSALIAPDCASVAGKLKAKRYRHAFTGGLASGNCTDASACGDRHYCDDAQSCICIRSAEGPIRCGRIPDSCYVRLCETSADCADLGEGYFCDTPNSGCCNDGELPRCIAPCHPPPCPPERTCGTACCPEGQECVEGTCAPSAPCRDDPVTAESLESALTALAQGATEVSLSPGGCFAYRRVLDAGLPSSETFTVAGRTAGQFDHTALGSTGGMDRDLDGLFDWRASLTTGSDPELDAELEEFDPTTGAVARRERRTTRAGSVHVTIESDGELVAEFDTPAEQGSGGTSGRTRSVPRAPAACDTAHHARYLGHLVRCATSASQCLAQKGRPDLERELEMAALKAVILCDDLGVDDAGSPRDATSPDSDRGLAARRARIVINPAVLDRPPDPDYDQYEYATVCHELMHYTSLGLHDPTALKDPSLRQSDRIYGCEGLCAPPKSSYVPTRCQCAACLEASACDDGCKGYRTCGAVCPCPSRHEWYPTLTECRVECPSGLACVGYTCQDQDVSCPGS